MIGSRSSLRSFREAPGVTFKTAGNYLKADLTRRGDISGYQRLQDQVRNLIRTGVDGQPEGPIDLALARRQSWQAVFLDLDATVIEQETIVELGRELGVASAMEQITEAAMAGAIPFTNALEQRVRLLQDLPEHQLENVLNRLTLRTGVEKFAAHASRRGVKLYLVSGGFTQIAIPIAKRLGCAGCFANTLEVAGKRLTGAVVGTVVDGAGKRQYLDHQMAEQGFDQATVVGVGDGANDRKILDGVGLAIGCRPKPVLCNKLDGRFDSADFAFLENLLFPS